MKIFYTITSILFLSLSNCVSPIPSISLSTDSEAHLSGYNNNSMISSAKILKRGESCYETNMATLKNFWGFTKRVSVEEAVVNAKISKIAVIDYKEDVALLGYYQKVCVIVWGE